MLPVTRALVDAAAQRLSGDGWQYTPRQLYYAACAAAETPRGSPRAASSGLAGLGVLSVLLGLIMVSNRVALLILVALGAVLVLSGLTLRWKASPEPVGRVLAMSYADFARDFCAEPREGMLDVAVWRQPAWLLAGAERVIVCDTLETAAAIGANAGRAGLELVALELATLPTQPPWSEVVSLHDASPRGCLLPHELRERGVVRVVDAGLSPGWVMGRHLQVIEGAPAQVPAELRGLLAADEVDWLEKGRRIELAALSPAQVMELVSCAVSLLGAQPQAGTVAASV